jgi:DNA-binding response OmpR family regulator
MDSTNSKENHTVKILIVEDEADILVVLKKGLEREGFTVETQQDPVKALEEFKPGYYDLLLFDIRMPTMTGFELYRQIRKIDAKVKVCFITAFEIYFDEFKKLFPKIHVGCFVKKPVTIKELAKAVHEELSRANVEEEEQRPQMQQNRNERKNR